MHNAIYAQDAVYSAPPVHAVYRAVHLWWRTTLGTTGASSAADDEQHMTVVNDLNCWLIIRYFSRICRTAVSVLGLAVGHWMEEALHVLAALHCDNTRKLLPTLVNVCSR